MCTMEQHCSHLHAWYSPHASSIACCKRLRTTALCFLIAPVNDDAWSGMEVLFGCAEAAGGGGGGSACCA